MIALASATGFISTLAHARRIALTAYSLHEGRVLDALLAAARRGADVRVRLQGDAFDDAAGTFHDENAAVLARLRVAGASAEATGPGEPVLHLKAAVVDGVAWLADRNWASRGPELIVRDSDPDDVAAVRSAVTGGLGSDAHLATTKAGAERLEADVIAHAGSTPLAVESESFGCGPIYKALLHRARAHEPTRLIVAGREVAETGNRIERAHLARLAALGVEVRTGDPIHGDLNEKLAAAGDAAWLGSANATDARGQNGAQRDWGLTTHDPTITTGLREAFERNWNAARPLTTL